MEFVVAMGTTYTIQRHRSSVSDLASNRTKKRLLKILIVLSFAMVMVLSLARLYPLAETVAVLDVVLAVALIAGPRLMCPSCESWYVRRKIGTQYLGTKTRTERRYSVDSPAGDFSYTHTVPAVYEEYQNNYVCRRCGHRWSTVDSRSNSSFMKPTAGMG